MSATPSPQPVHEFQLRDRELSWWLCVALLIGANLLMIGMVVYCIARRFGYPFELSWMEGCFVDHAQRILDGQPIYCEPSDKFIALLYTPIGHYLTAGMMKLGLNGFQATRAVSLLSLLATLPLCMWLAARAAPRRWLCLTIPGLVAATYFSADAYYDVGRPDQPMMLFCALAVVALTLRSSVLSTVAFVCCGLLAFWTKQSASIFLVVLLFGMFKIRRRTAIINGVVLVLCLLVTVAWAHIQTDGWFSFYVFKLPSYKMLVPQTFINVLPDDFLHNLAPLTLALVLALCVPALVERRGAKATASNRTYPILLSATAAAAVFSLVSRATVGGAQNVLILFAVFGATLLPVVIGRLVERFDDTLTKAVGWRLAVIAVAMVTLGGLRDYRSYVPGPQAVQTWRDFTRYLDTLGSPDRIWVQNHGAIQTDKGPLGERPHSITISDYVGGTGRRTGFGLPEKLTELIKQRYFDAIIFPAGFGWMEHQVQPYYRRDPSHPPITLPEFSGWRITNEEVWIRAY